ncbi:MAG: cytoplasmic protein [Planctomycetes bacterium]|nr:cytoplasmic protein [Planctomycetota bacterium]
MAKNSGHAEFISEPITPEAGTFDTASMARGEPGLPTAFVWRERRYEVLRLLDCWKESVAENHAPTGEKYYRRRYFTVEVDTGQIMTIYAIRNKPSGSVKKGERWWLYTIQRDENGKAD